MSTAEERFDTIVDGIESVTKVLYSLDELGLYGKMEYSAGVALLDTFERAIKVLDPEKAEQYLTDAAKKMFSKKAPNAMEELMATLSSSNKNGAGPYL